MIRRLFFLVGAAAAGWWLLSRRGEGRGLRAVVGYEDGSSLTLEAGSLQLQRLHEIARGVLRG